MLLDILTVFFCITFYKSILILTNTFYLHIITFKRISCQKFERKSSILQQQQQKSSPILFQIKIKEKKRTKPYKDVAF